MILYTENPKESTKKLVELIDKIQQGYRVRDQDAQVNRMIPHKVYYHLLLILLV